MDTNINITQYGFMRVATAVPRLKVADPDFNTHEIIALVQEADAHAVSLVVFPEMCITGYTVADLFFQKILQEKVKENIHLLLRESRHYSSVFLVGMPLDVDGDLYNVAVVMHRGVIYGIVPKTAIPNYKEFYEKRWFRSARNLEAKGITSVVLCGQYVPIGTDLLFSFEGIPDARLGIEICEDLWMPITPGSFNALYGATIIANLSASNETFGKVQYRRDMIKQKSGSGICSYIYTSCGPHESTTDLVFGGHAVIAENGIILKESKRFTRDNQLVITDVDIEHLISDRQHIETFGDTIHDVPTRIYRRIAIPHMPRTVKALERFIDPYPFVPRDESVRAEVCEEIFDYQIAGLAKRLEYAGARKAVLGVSGGLDSTLTLLVVVETFKRLEYPLENIYALTMPGFGTSKRTKSNVYALCEALGVTVTEIDITKTVSEHLRDIEHDFSDTKGVTYQNAQARYRKMLELDKGNQLLAIDAGTSDLSEIAAGWSTFAGDHISHYNVMAGVPKTLIRYIIQWLAKMHIIVKARKPLKQIDETPVSPELEKIKDGETISQKTDDIIGPLDLRDFSLYHFVRWGSRPRKILFLAEHAFKKIYTRTDCLKWLRIFLSRFFGNQWKRSVMPDGPKIGSVALSPRGDWRMPSDAEVTIWLQDLNEAAEAKGDA